MIPPYIFHEGILPSAYRYLFEEAIFNTQSFRTLQSAGGGLSFYILAPENFAVHAQCHFYIKDNLAKSPLRAPFGSVEFSPALSASVLFEFLKFVELKIRSSGVSGIVIKNPPDAYDPEKSKLLHTCLLDLGYQVSETEAGSVIAVGDKNFSELIHPRKKRKLNQEGTALSFHQFEHRCLAEVYHFIEAGRVLRKYTLSITLEDLERTFERCSEAYLLFGVRHEKKLVAASVAIRVNKKVLYHFISDHIRKVDVMSPALILMEGIYNYCFEQKIEILDLGTSMSGETPKLTLLDFKREIGGKPTVKYTFVKNLV